MERARKISDHKGRGKKEYKKVRKSLVTSGFPENPVISFSVLRARFNTKNLRILGFFTMFSKHFCNSCFPHFFIGRASPAIFTCRHFVGKTTTVTNQLFGILFFNLRCSSSSSLHCCYNMRIFSSALIFLLFDMLIPP